MLLHGLILVGAGHGIAVFFVMEVEGFFSVGYLMLLGQLCIVTSMFIPPGHLRMGSYIVGVLLLWASIYAVSKNAYVAWFTVIPFFVLTLATLAGVHIRKFFTRVFS